MSKPVLKRSVALVLLALCVCEQNAKAQTRPANELEQLFVKLEQDGAFNGAVLVAEGGRVVYRRVFGTSDVESGTPLDAGSGFEIASISKTFTAVAIHQLVERGKLSYDDTLPKFFPALPYSSVTIKGLLSHTSGLFDVYGQVELRRKFFDFYGKTDPPYSNEDYLAFLERFKPPLNNEPFVESRYSNTAYVLLGLIVEKVSGEEFDVFLRKNIFEPAGMADTFVFSKMEPQDVPEFARGHAAGTDGSLRRSPAPDAPPRMRGLTFGDDDMVSTLDDMLAFDQALRSGRLVSSATLDLARTPVILKGGRSAGYGLGFAISGEEGSRYASHSGSTTGFWAFCQFSTPENDSTVVLLTNVTGSGRRLGPIYQSIRRVLTSGQDRTLTVDDLGLEVGVSDPQLSPDGRSVVVVTSRPDYEENRFVRKLVLVDIANGTRTELTPQRMAAGAPRWSPSGDELAFVDVGSEGGQRQIFILPMSGGEARQITRVERGVGSFEWTADGSHFLFTSTDAPEPREGEERHNRSFEVGYNSYLTQAAPTSNHLWRIPASGGDAERLTGGAESIGSFVVSPDGRTVALSVTPLPHTGERQRSIIRLLDLASVEFRAVELDAPVYPGRFSPDGRTLSFSRARGPEPGFNPSGIFLQPLEGGAHRDVTANIDRSLGGGAWLPDGQSLLVGGTDLTWQALWHQPLQGGPRRLDLGDVHASAAVVGANRTVVFIGREAQRPAELYAMQAGEWEPRRVTDFNDALASRNLGEVKTIAWDGPDGFTQNGVLVYPPDFEEGRRYPLVLSIHGGPMGASVMAFNTFNQIMAAQGWLVFSPNYRGSSTQGKAFQSAVINDAGDGPGRDVMSGVEVLKGMGVVDESRIAVSGWSYGGYMTAWLTAHYQGWAVAMAGAAVTDWFDWYSMADMNIWAGYGLGGSPWLNDNAANYWRQSPMAYAHQIRTPTLIISNTGDERVTVSQSYKLYHALVDNGVEVKFVVYPVSGHFPQDPVHQRDLRRRWVEWIDEHFDRVTARQR